MRVITFDKIKMRCNRILHGSKATGLFDRQVLFCSPVRQLLPRIHILHVYRKDVCHLTSAENEMTTRLLDYWKRKGVARLLIQESFKKKT